MPRTPTLMTLVTVGTLLAVLGLAAPRAAVADEDASLAIGDPAPNIDVAHWIKGVAMDARGRFDPIETFTPGHVYVLEFWATWCGPCRRGMPHLSQLQEEYADRGVTIVGISDESLPKVFEFLWEEDADGQLQNDRTRYTLAADPDRSVFDAYMKATGQQGIPTAFVVGKDGRLEWLGHPSELDDVLEAVVTDRWDRAAFRAEYERREQVARALEEARGRLSGAVMRQDWDAVLGIFDELLAANPGNQGLRMQKLNVLLTRVDDPERARAYAREVVQDNWDDAGLLNMVAWTLVSDEEVRHPDLDFALKVAMRASELENHQDAAILDTVARAYYEKGVLPMARAWQEKAVAAATDPELRSQLEEVLAKYREESPSETPEHAVAEPSALLGTTWVLERLRGAAVEGERAPTLTFLADGKLSAFGGVNRMIGGWKLEDGALSIGPLAGTRMAGPEPLMAQEQKLAGALEAVDAYELEGGTLRLLAGGKAIATLRAAESK